MSYLYIFLWLVSGAASFIWWWTKDYDLTINEIWLIMLSLIGGPLVFFVGWLIHGDENEILIRKRGRKS